MANVSIPWRTRRFDVQGAFRAIEFLDGGMQRGIARQKNGAAIVKWFGGNIVRADFARGIHDFDLVVAHQRTVKRHARCSANGSHIVQGLRSDLGQAVSRDQSRGRDWSAPRARQCAASCGDTAECEIPPERAPRFPVEWARTAPDKASRKIATARGVSRVPAPRIRKTLREPRLRPRNARNSNARRASSFCARRRRNQILRKAGTSCAPPYLAEAPPRREFFAHRRAATARAEFPRGTLNPDRSVSLARLSARRTQLIHQKLPDGNFNIDGAPLEKICRCASIAPRTSQISRREFLPMPRAPAQPYHPRSRAVPREPRRKTPCQTRAECAQPLPQPKRLRQIQ